MMMLRYFYNNIIIKTSSFRGSLCTQASVSSNSSADAFGDYVGPGETKSVVFNTKNTRSPHRRIRSGGGKNNYYETTTSNFNQVKKRKEEKPRSVTEEKSDIFGTLSSSESGGEKIRRSAETSRLIYDYKNDARYTYDEEELVEEDEVEEEGEEIKFEEKSETTMKIVENDEAECDDPFDDEGPETRNFVVRKHTPWFFRMLQRKMANDGKIPEMVAVLEKRMLEDRVRPTRGNFSEAFTYLGRYGQPRKAFELYKKMCRMEIQSTALHRASLMNACANCSPSESEWAVNQTKLLLKDSRARYGALTPSEYHAAIKAFARHGLVGWAFRVADLMVLDRVKPDAVTFVHLLQACVADTASGFKLAMDVWTALRTLRIRASNPFYNGLLRACRDCGLGPAADRVVDELSSRPTKAAIPTIQELDQKLIDLDSSEEPVVVEESNRNQTDLQLVGPQQTNYKLSLLGGTKGILNAMDEDSAEPDVKTFSLLLDLLPVFCNASEEAQLLDAMRARSIRPDIDFMNALIARRCRRREFDSALELLDECTKKHGLQLNQRTFCSLAIGCYKRMLGLRLLRDMEALGLTPNIHVLTPLLWHALRRGGKKLKYDFFYAMSVMAWFRKANVNVPVNVLRHLEQSRMEAEQIQEEKRRKSMSRGNAGIGDDNNDFPLVRGLDEFSSYYRKWLRLVRMKDDRIDPKLSLLDKKVTADDVREDWEKPWVQQADRMKELDAMDKAKVIPVQ